MIVTLADMKAHLNLTDDFGTGDDVLIAAKIAAAQDHIERLLGFKVEATYGGTGQDALPASLVQAVQLLAAHWYENREATLVGVSSQYLPFGVQEIINEYRSWGWV